MKTAHFSGKLDALPATLDLLGHFDPARLAAPLSKGAARHAIAIGSGGSVVAAEYLARCRDTLGLGSTIVQTPMQAVMEMYDLDDTEVWLFSAGGENPDVAAAAQAVHDRHCSHAHLVTRNPHSSAAGIIQRCGGTVHVVPVADMKDGYLATHSLLAFTTALLMASDLASREPHGTSTLFAALSSRLTNMRSTEARAKLTAMMSELRVEDTMIVVADPLLRPMASLMDTSLWEAALCPVQTTDFRNLAHGRHAWLHHRPERTCVLALAGAEADPAWNAIDGAMPSGIRRHTFRYADCGRVESALSLIDGLGIIEAIGEVLNIDPGKPGIGDFGRAMYDDRSLTSIAEHLPAHVRHKKTAMSRADVPGSLGPPLVRVARDRLASIAAADVGGLVFDYDGTIVTTEGRYGAPDDAIVAELLRLHRAGAIIGIATGRGGSAGEELRKVLPQDALRAMTIGYYNGGHIRSADIDIALDRPEPNPAVVETVAWLRSRSDLFTDPRFRDSEVQITVDMAHLRHPYRFALDLMDCAAVSSGRIKILGSGHSYDLVPPSSSKLAVVERIRRLIPSNKEIMCFGDSGSKTGNDNALLAHPFGISVGEVCGSAEGCWSLFGSSPNGPDALLRTLQALIPSPEGRLRIDIGSLGLDNRSRMST